MARGSGSQLDERQHGLLADWLPGADVVRDLSWGLVGTTVLEIAWRGERYVVKAGDAVDQGLVREIQAHRQWLAPWTTHGHAPRLVRADLPAKLIVTTFLPGELVQDTAAEVQPDTYRQAGMLLARFHGQLTVPDDGEFEARRKQKALWWLDQPHRLDAATEQHLRDLVTAWPTPPSTLVPTHGDWQPRNWLIDGGVVRVIDFGRAELRPAFTDLARLEAQQFRERPDLAAAFLAGYGAVPGDEPARRRNRMREAIGTAVWSRQTGDERFERQGLRMVAEALAEAATTPE